MTAARIGHLESLKIGCGRSKQARAIPFNSRLLDTTHSRLRTYSARTWPPACARPWWLGSYFARPPHRVLAVSPGPLLLATASCARSPSFVASPAAPPPNALFSVVFQGTKPRSKCFHLQLVLRGVDAGCLPIDLVVDHVPHGIILPGVAASIAAGAVECPSPTTPMFTRRVPRSTSGMQRHAVQTLLPPAT